MANIINPNTCFRDLAQRDRSAYDSRINTIARLKAVQTKRALSISEEKELQNAAAIVDEIDKSDRNTGKVHEVCDPLFVATRTLFNTNALIRPELRSHISGVLAFDPTTTADPLPVPVSMVTLTIGLLAIDSATPPPVVVVQQNGDKTGKLYVPGGEGKAHGSTLYPDVKHPHMQAFNQQFFAAVGEARGYGALADRVLMILAREGDPDGSGGDNPTIECQEFARVMRGLAQRKISVYEPQLNRRVNEVLDAVQNVGGDDSIDIGIDLPDLEDVFDQNIVAENVRAMGPMIVSAMFDELNVFRVIDHIVNAFQAGTLPIGPGNAGKMLYRYWRDAPNRISEQERKNFAAITLGIPGGDPNGMINREFNDLWLRFVSSVSSFIRQNEVDALLRASVASPISNQQVRKAARDLAGNLSLHGYGMAHYAARELQAQIKFMIELLGDKEILGSYAARDMWQVVDQVATYELGGAKTSSRYRTLATCGTIITAWLANNVQRINRATGPLIDIDQVRNPDVAASHRATVNPSDYDLVNACELWLADTATSDSRIEEMSQPREAPQMTSKPIPIPAMAREMLDGMGDMGIGLSRGMAASPHAFAPNGYGGRPH